MSDKPTVVECLLAVMAEVGPIGKDSVNQQQHFRFRGIDAVTAALQPLFSKHSVLALPFVVERLAETRETKAGGSMNVVHLCVRFDFYGPAGDHVSAQTWGEAQDNADKATSKAHTAAYKVALVEALTIATQDMTDADETTVEAAPRAPVADPLVVARAELVKVGEAKGWPLPTIEEQFLLWSEGVNIRDASLEQTAAFTAHVRKQKAGTP
jgi:hypothetical protein